MPWKETCAMKQRFEFLAELTRGETPMAELCRRYEISRKTGYKWLERHLLDPGGDLADRSRMPLSCPHRTPAGTRRRLLEVKAAHPTWGPKKLKAYLESQEPPFPCPAVSTIGEILSAAGLVRPRRRRRETPPSATPLAHATGPNAVWCMDFKGWFRTGDGARVDPFTVTDADGASALPSSSSSPRAVSSLAGQPGNGRITVPAVSTRSGFTLATKSRT